MAEYQFGSGQLFAVRTDVTPSTPVQFGALQDVSVDFDFTTKELYGQYQFPLDVARGSGKIQGKAKAALIQGNEFNSIFFGQTMTASSNTSLAFNEVHTVPGTGPFTVTVSNTPPIVDEGVLYSATNLPLTKVTSVSATGQYSVNVATGVYTFNSTDLNAGILISYTYASASGNQIAIANQLMGTTPSFSVVFRVNYNSKNFLVTLNKCISTKLTIASKFDDYMIPEFDFMGFADSGNNIGSISLAE